MRIKPNRMPWDDANRLYELESKDMIIVLEQLKKSVVILLKTSHH